MNVPNRVLKEILDTADRYEIDRVVLFGSRARGTNRERSDIDLAVYGGNPSEFSRYLNEDSHTLLSFDIIDCDQKISEELAKEISRDGITIYEKIR